MRISVLFVFGFASLVVPAFSGAQDVFVPLAIITQQQFEAPADFKNVREWMAAAQAHRPGQVDEALLTVSKWPARSLAVTLTDSVGLIRLAAFLSTQPAGAKGSYRRHTFHVSIPAPPAPPLEPGVEDLYFALGVTSGDITRGRFNRILERGALLQTDLAMYVTVGGRANTDPSGPGAHKIFHLNDGEVTTTEDAGPYWRDAQFVVEAIDARPTQAADPSREPLVSLWYHAVTAWAASISYWSAVDPLLRRGVEVFPNDPRLLFDMGVLHEVYAEGGTQHAAQSLVRQGTVSAVRNLTFERRASRESLEAALAHDADLTEARLHLGNMLGRLDDHAGAIRELTRAAAGLHDPELEYDGTLLLAREQAAAGDREAARASYQRAAASYPSAPSPKFGLSRLQRLDDDGPGAVETLAFVAPPAPIDAVDDPWWNYIASHSRDAAAILLVMRKAFMKGEDQ